MDTTVTAANPVVSFGAYIAFFFFQAEDGIRDLIVTGVQTCALPISEAIDELGGKGIDLAAVHQRGDAAIEAEADAEIGDVSLGDEDGGADGDLRRPLLARRPRLIGAAARSGDRLLEHVLVELDADFANVPRLLLAQQVAGAADIHVVARQGEPGAQ